MELKTLYDSRTTLVIIRNLKDNWNGEGAKAFPETLTNRCWLICLKLSIQPMISPTARDSIQFEYELEDKSYLEFEIYRDKITVLIVENREYNKAIEFNLKALDKDSIIKDMNLLINLFHAKKFNEIRKLVGDAKK